MQYADIHAQIPSFLHSFIRSLTHSLTTKPVTHITYDMKDFLDSCVDRCCELAKVERKPLKPAATPFHERRVALPDASEEDKVGDCNQSRARF